MDLVKVSIEPKKLAKYTLKRACLRDFHLSEKQELKQPKKICALKIGDRALPPNPSQQPSSSRRKRSSQTSSELSSSEECLAADKMEKKRKEKGKRKLRGNCLPLTVYPK